MKLDPADLIDANDVAKIIGISRGSNVSIYRRRYPEFPEPVVDKGRCMLWHRPDVEAWARTTGRLPG